MNPYKLPLLLTLSLALTLSSCATQQPATVSQVPAQSASALQPPPAYIIQPGDQLDLKFFYNPELNETITVRPDGKIALQLIDEVQASGLTPETLDATLTKMYSRELKKPEVTVIVRSFTSQRVFVGGEVNKQGFVNLTAGMTPLQAVLEAGGLKETADPCAAILIRKGPENQPVPVRLDLKNALYGAGQGTYQLHPQDVVFVPKTFIAEANKFVKQYIEDLLLFRGVSLGFSYELHSESENR
jgi:polysaccharide biosynthesis/export protein